MATKRNDNMEIEIPKIIIDPNTNIHYKKGNPLGRGAFAKCYELTNMATNQMFAVKVIAKSKLDKPDLKNKVDQEIDIHRSIRHNHIVQFHTYFEDNEHIYIILELCSKRSLMEMHKRRKQLSEAEVRYFVRHICLACQYLHEHKIVHRDLKLGNLFINDNMELKVGDFGLATRIVTVGERKLTLCGTPNYVAPEILWKMGHSYEVDVWSLGCIVYTLVVGKPPFETEVLKDTYNKIKLNEFNIPAYVSDEMNLFIRKLLQSDPIKRPSMAVILNDPFMTKNYIPSRLPTTCTTVAPRPNNGRLSIIPAPELKASARKPLGDMANLEIIAKKGLIVKNPTNSNSDEILIKNGALNRSINNRELIPEDYYLRDLCIQLHKLINSKPSERPLISDEEVEDPESAPLYWISKWLDYTDKYGIGYQLCDNSVGVLFNDITRILLFADETNMQYIERDGNECFYKYDEFPTELIKKVTLLNYFRNYMNEYLMKTGEKPKPRDCDDLTRLPYLYNWFRVSNAIVFHLTNGTVQINFFQSHTKLILCPLMNAVTYINDKQEFRTYKFNLIEKYGCSKAVLNRICMGCNAVDKLLQLELTLKTRSCGTATT